MIFLFFSIKNDKIILFEKIEIHNLAEKIFLKIRKNSDAAVGSYRIFTIKFIVFFNILDKI